MEPTPTPEPSPAAPSDPSEVVVLGVSPEALEPLVAVLALGFGLVVMLLMAMFIAELGRRR